MGKDVIIACDFGSAKETLVFLGRFGELRPYVKVGMELFYSEGPGIVRSLKERGHKVFLDLKLHDIPNTVEHAMKVVAGLGADMCNVHAAGGVKMMEAAKRALSQLEKPPLLIAVTQLTSTSQEQLEKELLIDMPMDRVVTAYAGSVREAGLDGVVCSPLEAPMIHERFGKEFLTVTPGVRLEGDDAADQWRITTPAKARQLGSDYIVVGRSITAAGDPLGRYEQCLRDFVG